MTIFALVLAGGRGSRLGDVRKADLRIGGRSLFDRVTEHLAHVPLLVSVQAGNASGFAGRTCVEDEFPGSMGPMAGIQAAVQHLASRADQDDALLTVSVDTPFLPVNYLARMSSALDTEIVAARASWGENFYPTNAIYRLSALLGLLPAGFPDSPKRLQILLSAIDVNWAEMAERDPFANINTLSDVIALGRRAQTHDK